MKGRIFSILNSNSKKKGFPVIFMLCCLIIFTTTTTIVFAKINPDKSSSAYENNTAITKEMQLKLDKEGKEDILKKYSIYEKYGLTYNSDKDVFYYNNEIVRRFTDKLDNEGNLNSFTNNQGTVDIQATRNEKFKLVGIQIASKEDYDKTTKSIESALKNSVIEEKSGSPLNNNNGITEQGDSKSNTNNNAIIEEGSVDLDESSLIDYLDYGISYDKNNKQWIYGGKPIHYLTDNNNKTYMNNSDNATKNGILLKVIRTLDGKIEKIIEISTIE